MEQLKTHATIGVCGLDCGLCPRYYTAGPTRCPGCGGPGFSDKHPSCSFITCAVKKKGLEVCGQCADFPCSKFRSEDDYRRAPVSSAYPPYRNVMSNQHLIRELGIEEFVKSQRGRIDLLEMMLQEFDDGRSKSYFCRAAALLPPRQLRRALENTRVTENRKERAKALRNRIAALSRAVAIDLNAHP